MSRESYVHLALPGKPGAPTVFAFHGTGGDERQFVDLVADVARGATLIAPRGDVSEHGAARFFRRTAEGVYDMEDLARATARMAGFVKSHVGRDRASPVVGIGYSNGANILASVVFAEPGLFDAAVLMHPLIPFAPKVNGSLAGRRLLMTAGRHDPICPPNLTARLESYLRDAGAEVTLDWHEGGHEIRRTEIDAIRAFLAEPQPSETRMSDAAPEIQVEDSGSKGRYFITGPDGSVAEMTFTRIGDHQIIIDHTEVPDAFRGQGVGLRLVTRGVEDARAAGKKIIPLCPFANAQFRRHPEWADVLKS